MADVCLQLQHLDGIRLECIPLLLLSLVPVVLLQYPAAMPA